MANEENLKRGKATQFRSGEEAARTGQKGHAPVRFTIPYQPDKHRAPQRRDAEELHVPKGRGFHALPVASGAPLAAATHQRPPRSSPQAPALFGRRTGSSAGMFGPCERMCMTR